MFHSGPAFLWAFRKTRENCYSKHLNIKFFLFGLKFNRWIIQLEWLILYQWYKKGREAGKPIFSCIIGAIKVQWKNQFDIFVVFKIFQFGLYGGYHPQWLKISAWWLLSFESYRVYSQCESYIHLDRHADLIFYSRC